MIWDLRRLTGQRDQQHGRGGADASRRHRATTDAIDAAAITMKTLRAVTGMPYAAMNVALTPIRHVYESAWNVTTRAR